MSTLLGKKKNPKNYVLIFYALYDKTKYVRDQFIKCLIILYLILVIRLKHVFHVLDDCTSINRVVVVLCVKFVTILKLTSELLLILLDIWFWNVCNKFVINFKEKNMNGTYDLLYLFCVINL